MVVLRAFTMRYRSFSALFCNALFLITSICSPAELPAAECVSVANRPTPSGQEAKMPRKNFRSVKKRNRTSSLQFERLETRHAFSTLVGDVPSITSNTSPSDQNDLQTHADLPLLNFDRLPMVYAGGDTSTKTMRQLQLAGEVLVNSADNLLVEWRLTSGPGSVTFANPNLVNTTVQFSEPGSYELELRAVNQGIEAIDRVLVNVETDLTEPILPAFFDTTYAIPTAGVTRFVRAGDDLQAALNAANPGDVVVLEAGATFTGNFVLRAKEGEGWIYIISSAIDQLPSDGRIGPEHANLMPKLVPQNTNLPALRTLFGASNYRVAGVEFTTGDAMIQLVETGYGIPEGKTSIWDIRAAVNDAELPHHIVFDRVLVRSTSEVNRLRIGINLNGKYMAVINSHIGNIKDTADAQAILSWNGDGPYKINNNFLEATGENILFGGNDPSIPNSVPGDVEIRGNHFFKPLKWKSSDLWAVKNLFELKNARRVLIEGNVFQNNWADAQDGHSILLTVRNQGGRATWSTVEDVWFNSNIVRDVAGGFNILTSDYNHPSETAKRLKFTNNLLFNVRDSNARLFKISGKPLDYLIIEHNTLLFSKDELTSNPRGNGIVIPEADGVVTSLQFNNNIAEYGGYGIWFSRFPTPPSKAGNVIFYNPDQSRSNFEFSQYANYYTQDRRVRSFADIGFADAANGDYSLLEQSQHKGTATDGRDPGVDFTALTNAVRHTVRAGDTGSSNQEEAATSVGLQSDDSKLTPDAVDVAYALLATWNDGEKTDPEGGMFADIENVAAASIEFGLQDQSSDRMRSPIYTLQPQTMLSQLQTRNDWPSNSPGREVQSAHALATEIWLVPLQPEFTSTYLR